MADNSSPLNLQRRRIIQGTALSVAALSAPALATAACGLSEHSNADAPHLEADDVAIELVESKVSLSNGSLARVTVTNHSDNSIKLSHLSPGAVKTPKGVYQLNAILSDNPIAIRAGGSYQFWLKPDDGTQALLSKRPGSSSSYQKAMVDVTVISEYESSSWRHVQRANALI